MTKYTNLSSILGCPFDVLVPSNELTYTTNTEFAIQDPDQLLQEIVLLRVEMFTRLTYRDFIFLRKCLGLTQKKLSGMLALETKDYKLLENGLYPIDITVDKLMRIICFTMISERRDPDLSTKSFCCSLTRLITASPYLSVVEPVVIKLRYNQKWFSYR